MIEALRVAFQKREGRKRALLRVEFACFLEVQQRGNEESSRRIDDHDALAFLQRPCEMDALNGRANQHNHDSKEPESRETIFVDEDANRIGAPRRSLRWLFHWCRCAKFS